jgi:hypothetical protein
VAESSKEGYGSKRFFFLVLLLLILGLKAYLQPFFIQLRHKDEKNLM